MVVGSERRRSWRAGDRGECPVPGGGAGPAALSAAGPGGAEAAGLEVSGNGGAGGGGGGGGTRDGGRDAEEEEGRGGGTATSWPAGNFWLSPARFGKTLGSPDSSVPHPGTGRVVPPREPQRAAPATNEPGGFALRELGGAALSAGSGNTRRKVNNVQQQGAAALLRPVPAAAPSLVPRSLRVGEAVAVENPQPSHTLVAGARSPLNSFRLPRGSERKPRAPPKSSLPRDWQFGVKSWQVTKIMFLPERGCEQALFSRFNEFEPSQLFANTWLGPQFRLEIHRKAKNVAVSLEIVSFSPGAVSACHAPSVFSWR